MLLILLQCSTRLQHVERSPEAKSLGDGQVLDVRAIWD
jgi:hypothetical protein